MKIMLFYYNEDLDRKINYSAFEHHFLTLLFSGDSKELDIFLYKNKLQIPNLFVKVYDSWITSGKLRTFRKRLLEKRPVF